jgi:hypothetical protein
MNELKIRSGIEARLVDIKHALPEALNEDKAEICEHVLDGLKMPYKIEFRGARCWLPIPRPEVDYATRGGIGIWSEKSSFPMGLRNR